MFCRSRAYGTNRLFVEWESGAVARLHAARKGHRSKTNAKETPPVSKQRRFSRSIWRRFPHRARRAVCCESGVTAESAKPGLKRRGFSVRKGVKPESRHFCFIFSGFSTAAELRVGVFPGSHHQGRESQGRLARRIDGILGRRLVGIAIQPGWIRLRLDWRLDAAGDGGPQGCFDGRRDRNPSLPPAPRGPAGVRTPCGGTRAYRERNGDLVFLRAACGREIGPKPPTSAFAEASFVDSRPSTVAESGTGRRTGGD